MTDTSGREEIASAKIPRPIRDGHPDDIRDVVVSINAFGLDLFSQARTGEGNLIFSPYSVALALAMTYAGARGTTASEMAAGLHFSLPSERLHAALNAVDVSVTRPSALQPGAPGPPEIHFVNALWSQAGNVLHPAFLDLLASEYGAGLRLVDYAVNPERARAAINAWVGEETGDRILNLLPGGERSGVSWRRGPLPPLRRRGGPFCGRRVG